ncbi:hypothetical protein CC1G_14551 [Coprinopsis cinerea okayama7|uniref:Uncharacterized protein n=1 Tax=Coprinopsis cinerea (strain Okayama-7 / 130 / ATCC MYA-4618 / FGSC 9003) TaxID=240176 RepID=D6RMF7_COPC7|nr:hypothetical protein CC1G_14551 [Coprinopsis cinerea okayama7\|eukprot:XP_002911119.1 hypothetical protein CC1G_14551 [Coprinopsis cinerea okayama7\
MRYYADASVDSPRRAHNRPADPAVRGHSSSPVVQAGNGLQITLAKTFHPTTIGKHAANALRQQAEKAEARHRKMAQNIYFLKKQRRYKKDVFVDDVFLVAASIRQLDFRVFVKWQREKELHRKARKESRGAQRCWEDGMEELLRRKHSALTKKKHERDMERRQRARVREGVEAALQRAAARMQAAIDIPDKKDVFFLKYSRRGNPVRKRTGKDVRKALMNAFLFEENPLPERRPLVTRFFNRPYESGDYQGLRPIPSRCIPKDRRDKLKEFPIPRNSIIGYIGDVDEERGAARVIFSTITIQDPDGSTRCIDQFHGLVSHDEEEDSGDENEHYYMGHFPDRGFVDWTEWEDYPRLGLRRMERRLEEDYFWELQAQRRREERERRREEHSWPCVVGKHVEGVEKVGAVVDCKV